MKRIIALLLCLVMVAGLVGCSSKKDDTPKLQVGFGRADITPQYSMMLWGYPGHSARWSNDVLDPLYASCVAFTDAEGNTILAFTVDLLYSTGSVTVARMDISEKTGVPAQNIVFSATHTHSGPVIESNDDGTVRYAKYLKEQIIAAAEEALADRKPAEIYTTSTRLTRMNFVRHYLMNDGTVAGANFGSFESGIVKHMREADNEMQLIRFKREGGKDVVLVNWQAHPLRTGSATASDISADFVGAMRIAMEPQLDCYMAYYGGASGDLMPTSMVSGENLGLDYMEQGAMLANQAILAMDTMTKVEPGKVQIIRKNQDIHVNKNTSQINLYAFSIGEIAFITAPYEMFDTNAMYVKENSPFDMTFVLSNANGSASYIAAEWAYYDDILSYEVGKANYNKGTGEAVAESFVEMLNELYPTRK